MVGSLLEFDDCRDFVEINCSSACVTQNTDLRPLDRARCFFTEKTGSKDSVFEKFEAPIRVFLGLWEFLAPISPSRSRTFTLPTLDNHNATQNSTFFDSKFPSSDSKATPTGQHGLFKTGVQESADHSGTQSHQWGT